MKVIELIKFLQDEIAENAALADAEVLTIGEETGKQRPAAGYVIVQSQTPALYLVSDEDDFDDVEDSDEA